MKKLFYFIIANMLTVAAFAQQPCNSTEEVNNLQTIYTKKQSRSAPTVEQAKWMNTCFSSVIEPAFKSTKGMRGNCTFIGSDSKTTPEKLMKTEISSYLAVLRCNKEHKIYEAHESGLVIRFSFNSLENIANISERETTINNQMVYVKNTINGSQIYNLQESTESEKYEALTFYRKTDNAKYFLITKQNVPFFIPVTVRQALELNKKNILTDIEELKKYKTTIKLLSKEEFIKKEGVAAIAGAITAKQAEELNDAGYKGHSEGTKQALQQIQFMTDLHNKNVAVMDEFLKTSSTKILDQPVYGSPFSFYTDENDLKAQLLIDSDTKVNPYVIINPAYLNPKLSKTALQFISFELRTQTNDAVTQKAFKDFETNLDFEKLQSLLVK